MHQQKLDNLQAGRGIAALMVVLYHANGGFAFGGRGELGHIFSFGFAGVDFFFVLSGFIIAYTSFHLFREKQGIGVFLRKRIIRIYPIYWVYMLFAAVTGLLFYRDPNVFSQFWKTLLLLPEHHTVIETSWTLPFELFFYLLFAFLILSRWSLVIIVPVLAISAINAVQQNLGNPDFFGIRLLNELCSPFNLEFLFGFCAFLIYKRISKPAILVLAIAVMATMVLEILYFPKAGYTTIYQGERVLPFGLLSFGAVTTLAAMDHHKILKTPGFLVSLGNASYTLYLVHTNIFNLVNDQVFRPMHLPENSVMILMEFVVAASIYISFLLYRFIEKPLLRKMSVLISASSKASL